MVWQSPCSQLLMIFSIRHALEIPLSILQKIFSICFFEIYISVNTYSNMLFVWSFFNWFIVKKYILMRIILFFLEKITSCAGLVGSGLNSIFHFGINERSSVRSLRLFLIIFVHDDDKIDVSSANSFTLLFNPFCMSLKYIKTKMS